MDEGIGEGKDGKEEMEGVQGWKEIDNKRWKEEGVMDNTPGNNNIVYCCLVSSPDPPEKWKEDLVFRATLLVTWAGANCVKI